jgi:hypothetical protein
LTLRFRPIMQNVALSATTFTGVSAQLEFWMCEIVDM